MIFNPKNFMLMKALFGGNSGSSGDPGEVLDGLEIVPDFSAGDYEVVAPTGLLVRSAIIKKPKTLVPDNIAEGVEIAGVVGTHVGGGSSGDNRVKYVTFMYGETELIKYPVISGDTCRDPVANGFISTPTKESTAQYNYTFYGWGASDGGAANANILNNITEDKTVYAIFSSTLRTYTITWLDDDGVTVLKTQSVAYGTVPSYTPSKDDVIFSGWIPEVVAVTGDASYTAQWEEGVDFATASWAKIAEVVAAGKASSAFKLKDTRQQYMGSKLGTVTLMIIGFDVDRLADGTTAGMTIGMATCGGTVLTYPGAGNTYRERTDLYKRMQDDYKGLPQDLKNVIKPALKATQIKVTQPAVSLEVVDFEEPLWLFTPREFGNYVTYNSGLSRDNFPPATVYPAVGSNTSKGVFKALPLNNSGDTISGYYPVRDSGSNVDKIYGIYQSGTVFELNAASTSKHYMRYGFCI